MLGLIGMALAAFIPAMACGDASVRAAAAREDTKIFVAEKEGAATVDITCPFGIDRATVTRGAEGWPAAVTVWLHLKGLEAFEVTSGSVSLGAAVPSTGEPIPCVSLRQDGAETALDKNSPYWMDIAIIGGHGKIPLEKGHFEIPLPAKLFEGNPASIELRWVDFYRN